MVKENPKLILENIKKIHCNANAILKFDFWTLYIKLTQFDLISVLNDTIEPHLKGVTKKTMISSRHFETFLLEDHLLPLYEETSALITHMEKQGGKGVNV